MWLENVWLQHACFILQPEELLWYCASFLSFYSLHQKMFIKNIWTVTMKWATFVPSQDTINLGLLVFRIARPVTLNITIHEVLQWVRVVFGIQVCHLFDRKIQTQFQVQLQQCETCIYRNFIFPAQAICACKLYLTILWFIYCQLSLNSGQFSQAYLQVSIS